jgi:hypothetical protein
MPTKRACTLGAAIALAVELFQARPAEAGVPEATAHYDKGIVQYNLGHFSEAISEFEKAYELDASPILLFNLAQAYRQEGNTERAIFFYRRYLTLAPTAKNRGDVEKRLKELEELRQRQDDIKGKPPTGIDAGGASATEPTAPPDGAHATGSAPPQPPTNASAPAQPAPAEPNDPTLSDSETVTLFGSGGVAISHFTGRDLASPATFSGELGGRLVLLPGNDRMEVGVAGVLSFLSYSRTDGQQGKSGFPGVFADARVSHGLGPRARLGLGLGLGVLWWTGLDDKNPFTVGGAKASGAVAMPSLRVGPSVSFKVAGGLYAGFSPRFVFSKTTSAGLSDAISSVLRFELPIEVGYVF